MRSVRATALAMLAAVLLPLLDLSQGAAADCPREAATLSKEQADLPRLEIASPKDRPPYCITLETLMAFSGRVKAHIAQCPTSDYASTAAEWLKSQPDFRRLFAQYRCKRTL